MQNANLIKLFYNMHEGYVKKISLDSFSLNIWKSSV